MSDTKQCSRCQRILPLSDFNLRSSSPDGRQRYCRHCMQTYYAAYSRTRRQELAAKQQARYLAHSDEQRAKRRRHKAANRQQARAHLAVAAAIKRGDLPHPSTLTCQHCGRPATEYHHDDYSRPLDVVALCHGCHMLQHAVGKEVEKRMVRWDETYQIRRLTYPQFACLNVQWVCIYHPAHFDAATREA